MTGFGTGSAARGSVRIVVQVSSVNHRALEVRTSFPPELAHLEAAVLGAVRKRIQRGSLDVRVRLESGPSEMQRRGLDTAEAARWIQVWGDAYALAQEHLPGLGSMARGPGPSVEWLLSCPGVVSAASGSLSSEETAALVAEAVERALDEVIEARRLEGAALAEALRSTTARIAGWLDRIEAASAHMPSILAQRWERRLADAKIRLGDAWDSSRVEQELIIALERNDISEEIDRLRAHLMMISVILSSGFLPSLPADCREAGGQGKRLQFLGQELLRESNTIASKAGGLQICQFALEARVEIERFREQTANIE